MSILKKISNWDIKLAVRHGIKFNGKTSDMLLYVLPRTVVGGLVLLLVAYLVIA